MLSGLAACVRLGSRVHAMPGLPSRRFTGHSVVATLAAVAAFLLISPVDARANAHHVCNTLLDQNEALHAMAEAKIEFEGADYSERLLHCNYDADSPPDPGNHSLSLAFGNFAHFRESGEFDAYGQAVCYVSQRGCELVHKAERVQSDGKAFALWGKAFDHAGTAHSLDSGFRGNPALIWVPKHPPLAPVNVAFVYHHRTGKTLRVTCVQDPEDGSEQTPDNQCAIPGLRRAFHNLVTR